MNINNIVWLTQFVEKIERKHGVSADEVEEVFNNHPRFQRIERGDVAGENLYRALGQTDGGRYLAVFFIHKGRGGALVISARDASLKERRSYGKK
ncbi:MAG: uncharacterized protein QOC99_803 [Acidobacteriota bacterium]|jgi:uncharacterized DUF497 family protein|nr:uncharacterized protein [Acidobacteriota bacterium]MDT7778291.1 uncharacterized protein [Acidobacteriota bacterium]